MKIKKFPKNRAKYNYCYIIFRLQAIKQETKQSVKRAERKWGDEVKTESAIVFTRKNLQTRSITNTINQDEWYIRLLHDMLSVGKGKTNSRSHEMCQVICPLNEQSQNKKNFGKIYKIQDFKVDNNSNGISCNRNVKIDKMSWN